MPIELDHMILPVVELQPSIDFFTKILGCAFALPRAEFDAAFDRVKAAGIPFGDSFHAVGNMQGPGVEAGSRGDGESVYFFDPNQHLVELRHYGP
jgi:catechol 2,3-dioxygenase-like lactoylglutathione lyase family enzyme